MAIRDDLNDDKWFLSYSILQQLEKQQGDYIVLTISLRFIVLNTLIHFENVNCRIITHDMEQLSLQHFQFKI